MLTRSSTVLLGLAFLTGVDLRSSARRAERPRTIDTVTYFGFNMAMPFVLPVYRGVTANFIVNGDLVDLSTGVEIRTSGGATASGIEVAITGHSNGPSTACTSCAHLNIRLTSTTAASGTYKVLIHYLVETRGPDEFDVRLFDHGSVSSVFFTAPAQLPNGGFLVGDQLTVQLSGSSLSNAALRGDSTHGMHLVQTVSTTATTATFIISYDSSGMFAFPAGMLFDKNSRPGDATLFGGVYGGLGSTPIILRLQPKVTSATPAISSTGSSITIAGTRLNPKGYSTFVDFVPKYKSSSSQVVSSVATAVSGGLVLTAPQSPVAPDTAVLRFAPSTTPRDSLTALKTELPLLRVIGYAPSILQFDSVGGSGARRPMLKAGQQMVAGKSLVSEQLSSGTTSTSRTSPGIDIGTISTLVTSLPTVSFGSQALSVQSAGYRATSTRIPGLTGADTLIFTVPPAAFSDTATRALTITTTGGSQTTQNVVFVPAPTVTDVRTFNASGIEVSVPLSGGTLVRGKQYRLKGKGLVIVTGALTAADVVRATLNGAALQVTLAPAPNVDPVITIPSGAAAGALVVTGAAGAVSVGTFTVTDPPAALTIAGFSLSPTTVTGGKPISATIAINGTVPPGGSAGNVALTMATPNDAIVLPTGVIAVTSNPLVVSIGTKAVATQQTASIRVSSDPNTAPVTTSISDVTLAPPNPTSVVFPQSAVAGGTAARGVVHLNTSALPTAGLTVALVNSDPTTATVPSTATMSGDTAVFNVTTAVVPNDRTITVTASIGGVSQSGTLTVRAATLSSVSVSPASLVPGAGSVTVTVTLSGPVPAPTTATLSCDPALVCPASVTFAQGQSSVTFTATANVVPAAVAAPITVTFNGASRQASINLTPLAIATLTLSPTTVQAGSPSSLTIQLNAPVPANQTVSIAFSSSNASVVPVPANVTFTAGQVAKLVNLATHAPVGQTSPITIGVTSSQTTSTTPNTSTKSATLTVSP